MYVLIVEALARDWRRTDRLGIEGADTGRDEVGRSSEVNGRNRRLGRRNCLSAICTIYDKLSGRIDLITPEVSHKNDFGSWIRTDWPGSNAGRSTL